MRAVIQRVSEARVDVDGAIAGQIDAGLVVLLGIAEGDDEQTAAKLAAKIAGLRIFSDEAGKFNLSALDVGGAILLVSQFTLFGDTRRGNRPSFLGAAPPEVAEQLVERVAHHLRQSGLRVAMGVFRAHMRVSLVNDGPVTIILDSEDWTRPRRG
jgi:D-tyrosyl-tRNA(Tyr) deacylase